MRTRSKIFRVITRRKTAKLVRWLSGGYVSASSQGAQMQPASATLRQGYLEGSNISVVGEMANMMTAMRTFEANQKVIQMHDDRLGRAITDLGNPT